MKEATGELNMTVITVVAIAAIGVLFYSFIWPMIKLNIVQRTCDAMGPNYTAERGSKCTADCIVADSDKDQADASGETAYCCCKSAN